MSSVVVYFRTSEEEKALLWLVSTESSPLHPALSTAAAKSITAPVQTAHVERPCVELTIVRYNSGYHNSCLHQNNAKFYNAWMYAAMWPLMVQTKKS